MTESYNLPNFFSSIINENKEHIVTFQNDEFDTCIFKDYFLKGEGIQVKLYSLNKNNLTVVPFVSIKLIDGMCPEEFAHKLQQSGKSSEGSEFIFQQNENQISDRMIFSVSELTTAVKRSLKEEFSNIWITGEVSGYSKSPVGHIYFTLKDEKACIKAAFFKFRSRNLKFTIEDGMKLEVYGNVSIYEKNSSYQIIAERVLPEGKGELQLAFEQLKEKLQKEGLFNKEHKKKIPKYPDKVGIITSPTGAAFRDILRVTKTIFPAQNLILYPTMVQGEKAAAGVASMIELANNHPVCDLLIITRGGGSPEDLWPFNEEILARAIFKSKIPVISAIGHEVDYFISDFVADWRAATPSAAAEVISRMKYDLINQSKQLNLRLFTVLDNRLARMKEKYEYFKKNRLLNNLLNLYNMKSMEFDMIFDRTLRAISDLTEEKKQFFLQTASKLSALSPNKVLERGYSVVFHNKKIITNSSDLKKDDKINIKFHKGNIDSKIL